MDEPFDSVAALARHYADSLAAHGEDDPRAVGWNTAHGQLASFLQMAAIDGLEPGARVLDLGCGLGDFKTFLDRSGVAVDYTGWDISAPLIERARARHPGVRFEVRDILADPPVDLAQAFDIVVCCGALTLRVPDHERWVQDMVHAMFRLCRRGLVFNLLSAYYAHDNPMSVAPGRYYYALPEEIFCLCTDLSRQITIDHCAVAQSFAVYVYRHNTRPMERLAAHLLGGAAASTAFGPAHRIIAAHYEEHGMYAELLAYLDTLTPHAAGPAGAALWDQIGLAAFQLGDDARQRAAFERAVALDPAAVAPLVHLAVTHTDAGRFGDALPLLERAHALAPADQDIAAKLARCRARVTDADGPDAYGPDAHGPATVAKPGPRQ